MARSTIEQRDGKTVVVTEVSSEQTANRLKASIEDDVLRSEGEFFGTARVYVRKVRRGLSDLSEEVDRAYLLWLTLGFAVIAVMLSWKAWPAAIPIDGLETVVSMIGVMVVLAITIAAHQLWKAFMAPNRTEFWWLVGVLGLCLIVNVAASVALQAQTAMDRQTGWEDVQARIETLKADRGARNVQLLSISPDPSAESRIRAEIEAQLSAPIVNRLGDQLNRTVRDTVGDCDSSDGIDYYEGTYCPELTRKRGQLKGLEEQSTAYTAMQAEIAAIDAEIVKLETSRPTATASLSFLTLFDLPPDWDAQLRNTPWLQNALLTLFVDGLVLLFGILAGRRSYRFKHTDKPQEATA